MRVRVRPNLGRLPTRAPTPKPTMDPEERERTHLQLKAYLLSRRGMLKKGETHTIDRFLTYLRSLE